MLKCFFILLAIAVVNPSTARAQAGNMQDYEYFDFEVVADGNANLKEEVREAVEAPVVNEMVAAPNPFAETDEVVVEHIIEVPAETSSLVEVAAPVGAEITKEVVMPDQRDLEGGIRIVKSENVVNVNMTEKKQSANIKIGQMLEIVLPFEKGSKWEFLKDTKFLRVIDDSIVDGRQVITYETKGSGNERLYFDRMDSSSGQKRVLEAKILDAKVGL